MLKHILFAIVATVAIPASNAAEKTGLAPQISNERSVKVTVTPKHLSRDAKTWEFEVTLETHTQDLKDDLVKSSTLIADGMQHAPLEWKGAPPGGHHRKGVLSFKAITPQPPSMELQIRLTGDAAPRTFKWLLKGAGNGK